MEFRDYVGFLSRRWLLLLLIPATALIVTYLWSRQLTPIYESTATVLLVNQVQPDAVTSQVNDLLIDERLIQTYVELIERRPVLAAVVQELSLPMTAEELAEQISVANDVQTQIIRITAHDSNASLAADMANTTTAVFIEQTETDIGRPGTVRVAEPAVAARTPVEPNLPLNLILAGFVSLIVSIGLGLVLNYLDSTARSPEDVQAASGLPLLGMVYRVRLRPRQGMEDFGLWALAEDYRGLRAKLDSARQHSGLKSLLIVSENAGEGRSITAANLALSLAQAGENVVLVDADLRRPHLHELFQVPNAAGLAAVLNGLTGFTEALETTRFENLMLLPAGTPQPNQAEKLSSRMMAELIEHLTGSGDIIIFDSPPMSAFADASILAAKVDASILVVESRRTRASEIRQSVERLSGAKGGIIGVVVNKVRGRRDGRPYQHWRQSSRGTDAQTPARAPATRRFRRNESRAVGSPQEEKL
ncbi:MAG: polysaccharide biosynthesis tyrosine autokinase [Dehalococcoidia bacterium]|nr:polysaccharide biosynthesis tyrosine autokinase [Dehalococcoidia bacterium]